MLEAAARPAGVAGLEAGLAHVKRDGFADCLGCLWGWKKVKSAEKAPHAVPSTTQHHSETDPRDRQGGAGRQRQRAAEGDSVKAAS